MKRQSIRRTTVSKADPLYLPSDESRIVPQGIDPEEQYRTSFRRDFARLVHSAAFRRLQGKTQLFPNHESDFFRNRLTHSLEVAQVAKSIAIRFNYEVPYFQRYPIDCDLVETAALAHDLGHPPFGHNGEEALNECMARDGGFEGNAQTLRILARLEKRQTRSASETPMPMRGGRENRAGLNLTFRTLASTLKYDNRIPRAIPKRTDGSYRVVKGFYESEADVVAAIKKNVGIRKRGTVKSFKTIECSIMDVADDIAYSTYDLEDAFKGGFLSPLAMIAAPQEIINNVAKTVSTRLNKNEAFRTLRASQRRFTTDHVYFLLIDTFSEVFGAAEADLGTVLDEVAKMQGIPPAEDFWAWAGALVSLPLARTSKDFTDTGYYRTKLTSEFVGQFIHSVDVKVNEKRPDQSRAYLPLATFKQVEVLKNFAFEAIIGSPRLKVAEHRGKEIIQKIFKALEANEGYMLMPDDCRVLYNSVKTRYAKRRVICDFIAGMTDRYAIQFYNRLFGTVQESIYVPL